MTICEDLRQAVLQAAIQGKLTKQLPEDGNAADLLAAIKAEKEQFIKEKKIKKEKSLAPISEDEIPFEIPDNWIWVKLGELTSKIGAGSTPSGGKNSDVYVQCGIKFLRSMNIYNDGLHYSGMVYISPSLANERQNSAVYGKDILLNITGGSIGRCALVPDDFDLGNVNQHVLIIRNIRDENRFYIHLCICSPMVQSLIFDKAVGDKAGFSAEKAKNILIPLPPLSEQHRIVARVNELMAKIDELEVVEKELVALKKAFPGDMKDALLQAAMQGKLTEQLPEDGDADTLLEAIEAEKAKLVAEKKIKKQKPLEPISEDEIPFEIPDNWEWVRLGEIGTWGAGATPQKGEPKYYKGGTIPWLITGELNNGYVSKIEGKITEYALEHTSVKLNPVGSVLIAMYGATIGKLGILSVAATTNQACCACYPYKGVFNRFLFYFLMANKRMYLASAEGGAQPNISKEKIVNTLMPLPPIAEQHRIVEKLDKLLPLCDALSEEGVA